MILLKIRHIQYPILMALALMLAGCDNNQTDLEAFVSKVDSQQKSKIQPLPTIKSYDAVKYSAEGLRDPFVPILSENQKAKKAQTENDGISPDSKRSKEPLEAYPLAQLRFVGTLSQGKSLWALIQTPKDIIYRVTQGDYMGLHSGKILLIGDSKIKIKEIVADTQNGGYKEQVTSIVLAAGAN